MTDTNRDIEGIGALADPLRRQVYDYVVAERAGVSRDQTADALRLPRHRATFHLERLERAGLLRSEYVRLTGRSGPGAGRPAKVYRRSGDEIAVSLPGRQDALAGALLASAVELALRGEVQLADALTATALQRGEEIADGVELQATRLDTAQDALQRLGYEPELEDGRLVLANCPFHALASQHTALVCGINHDLITGLCSRLGGLQSSLDPKPGRCCVVIERDEHSPTPPRRISA